MRILIVEDNETYRLALEDMLREEFQDEGIEIEAATTVNGGQEALDNLYQRGKQLDAIILDAKLPKEEGGMDEIDLTLVEHARKRFPDSLIVIFSAYVGEQVSASIKGVNVVLSKNASKAGEQLIQVLREYPLLKRLHNIFGDSFARPGGETRYGGGPHHCVSWPLNTLVADILRVYHKLSPETRAAIERYMHIEKDDQGNPTVNFHHETSGPVRPRQ